MPQHGYWTSSLLDARIQAGDFDLSFPVSERQVSGGRAWARRRYPFRSGQSDEDTGGDPRTISYVVPLWRDVNEEDYPNLFLGLVEVFESDEVKGRATLHDPELGPMPVRLIDYAWSTDPKERDGGNLKLNFETLGSTADIATAGSQNNSDETSSSASSDADAVDDALADAEKTPTESATKMREAGVPITGTELLALGLSESFAVNIGLSPGITTQIPQAPPRSQFTTSVSSSTGFGPTTIPDNEVRLFTALATRFESRLQTGAIATADEIGAELDTLLERIAAVRNDADITSNPRVGAPVLAATSRLMSTLTKLAENAFRDAPLVVDYELTGEQSAVEVAVALFGDPNRVYDIIQLNPSVSPDFYPNGTILVVPIE